MKKRVAKKPHSSSKSSKLSHQENNFLPPNHPLASFFECCLSDEPAPLSDKIQELREKIPSAQKTQEIHLKPGQKITITKDMIIGDILVNFPQTKALLEDLHPLGLLSPLLHQTTVEIFLSDLDVNTDQICAQLTQIIASTK